MADGCTQNNIILYDDELTNIIDTHVLSRLVYKMVRPLKKCTKKNPVRAASPCHCIPILCGLIQPRNYNIIAGTIRNKKKFFLAIINIVYSMIQ